MDEFVDIVNNEDKVIGRNTREIAHNKGLLHRTVIGMVVGKDGKWTLIKQSLRMQDAMQFVCPIGGHVESGETEEEAIKREASEEYGLTGTFKFKLLGKKVFNREVVGRKENHLFVVYEIYTDKNPILNDESVEYIRLTKAEVVAEITKHPEKFGGAFHFVMNNFYSELIK